MSTVVEQETKAGAGTSHLDQLKKFTKVVADWADFEIIRDFIPQDASNNPILVYAATQKVQYGQLIEGVLNDRD